MATRSQPVAAAREPEERVEPITLDQLVDRVLGGPTPTVAPKKGSKLRRVLPGRRRPDRDAPVTQEPLEPMENLDRPGPAGRDLAPELSALLGFAPGRGPLPWLTLGPVFAPDNPQACLRDLRTARADQVRGLGRAAVSWREARRLREIGLRASVLSDLVEIFPDHEAAFFRVAEANAGAVRRVLERVPRGILKARGHASEVYNSPLARRIEGALLLLASPSIRGAVPEAPKLRPRAVAMVKLTTKLADVEARVDHLDRRRERYETLVRLARRLPESVVVADLMTREARRLRAGVVELRQLTHGVQFPDLDGDLVVSGPSDAQGSSVGSVYALDAIQVHEVENEDQEMDTSPIDDLRRLNQRALTELAKLTLRVERGLKLKPLGQVEIPRAA